MADNKEFNDELTLEQLQSLVRTDENAVIAWLYPRVMARLQKDDYLSDYLHDGFNDRSQKVLSCVAKAPSVRGFLSLAVIATKNAAIDLWRKQERQRERQQLADEIRPGQTTKNAQGAKRKPKKRAVRREIYDVKRDVVLPRLTPTERRLFEIYFGERLTAPQIALVMDWTMSYCYRACSLLSTKVAQVLSTDMKGEDDEQ